MTAVEAYEEHEIRAWRDLARAAGRELLTADVATYRESDFLLMAAPRCVTPTFNRVLGIGCRGPVTAEMIAVAMAWYEKRGLSSFWLQLGAEAAPRNLETWLRQRRFVHSYDSALLACRRASDVASARSSLEIRRIGAESAGAFGRVAAEAFGWPPAAERLAASVVGRAGWYTISPTMAPLSSEVGPRTWRTDWPGSALAA